MRIRNLVVALAISSVLAAAPAMANDTVVLDLKSTSDSAVTGTNGNNTVDSTGNLSVTSTAWNLNYNSTNKNYVLTTAYLGTYQYGLGVTSASDDLASSTYTINGQNYTYDCASGDCGTHQIDNMGNTANSQSYDFVQLTFNKAVTLNGLTLESFGTANAANNAFVSDTDFSYGHASTALVAGTTYTSLAQLFGTVGTTVNGASVSRTTCENATFGSVCGDTWTATASDVAAGTASKIWLVGASVNGAYGGDGKVDSFKIATFNAGVPEPTTWASMVLGFGVAGAALRRRRSRAPQQA